MGPCDLDELVKQLELKGHPDLLVGPEHGSDAGVYRLSPEIAIVQSADFFPPMIADAYHFGRVAAANALSDVFALGARPVTALNLLATPKETPREALVAMLDGSQEVILEAGAVVSGGHTILGNTVMFGLSATGVVHPDRIVKNTTAQPGDKLVLTKPLGSGITVHAHNAGQASDAQLADCIDVMATLNRLPSELMLRHGANAATDITGFGLLGHALDMLSLKEVGFEINYADVPLMPEAEQLALAGNYPGGSKRNQEYTDDHVEYAGDSAAARLVLNDAQTSGGLLIALPPEAAAGLVEELNGSGYAFDARIIGEAVGGHVGKITVHCQ
jgi:selenide,water dikinase